MLADDGALRRKLGDRAGCLQTVRGVGCRFTAAPGPRPGAARAQRAV
jgi:hypothetical protein